MFAEQEDFQVTGEEGCVVSISWWTANMCIPCDCWWHANSTVSSAHELVCLLLQCLFSYLAIIVLMQFVVFSDFSLGKFSSSHHLICNCLSSSAESSLKILCEGPHVCCIWCPAFAMAKSCCLVRSGRTGHFMAIVRTLTQLWLFITQGL